jgi:hypothetical protein
MQVCPACGNQFFTNPERKRQTGETISMQMTDLAPTHSEENNPPRFYDDLWLVGYFTLNPRGNRIRQHHSIYADGKVNFVTLLEGAGRTVGVVLASCPAKFLVIARQNWRGRYSEVAEATIAAYGQIFTLKNRTSIA